MNRSPLEIRDPAGNAEPMRRCWGEVGVYGSCSCPELKALLHCRNCAIFATAATQVLNRPPGSAYKAECTERLANEPAAGARSTLSAVPFRVGGEWLALPTLCVQEVTERRAIHSLPRGSRTVLGLASVRGELVLCVSLGHLLGFYKAAMRHLLEGNYQRLIVLNLAGSRAAFPVDEVHGPHRFNPSDVKPASSLLGPVGRACAESVLVWRQRHLIALNPDEVLSNINGSLE